MQFGREWTKFAVRFRECPLRESWLYIPRTKFTDQRWRHEYKLYPPPPSSFSCSPPSHYRWTVQETIGYKITRELMWSPKCIIASPFEGGNLDQACLWATSPHTPSLKLALTQTLDPTLTQILDPTQGRVGTWPATDQGQASLSKASIERKERPRFPADFQTLEQAVRKRRDESFPRK